MDLRDRSVAELVWLVLLLLVENERLRRERTRCSAHGQVAAIAALHEH